MRKKVSLIIMVLTILIVANLSLNANAQPGGVGAPPGTDATKQKLQRLQSLQDLANKLEGEIQDLANATEEQKSITAPQEEQTGASGSNTQQQLQKQIEQKQQELKQVKLKMQQLQLQSQQQGQQQGQTIQGPPPRLRH